ncbi:hypothetical protein AVEN_170023-1 [Araneus ventricosus]|uniref:Uncharacterized protein n=1 Tax=Araneus ventricosus TaxID=182803 RepID=A0A4Y2VDI4_ARAVE|nr:hypothetical protein AVEN_105440-1 [Araneus ventricosus]GBO23319.1 hypothetical protein AVEN_170023-1 [Araneus ventricosus]
MTTLRQTDSYRFRGKCLSLYPRENHPGTGNRLVVKVRLTATRAGSDGLVVRLWGRRVPLKIRRVWGLLHVKSYVVPKDPPVGVAWNFGVRLPAQVSSSSSDGGSKL